MKIESLEIRNWSVSSMYCSCEGLTHVKSLSCLSIVQATEGWYDLSLDGGQSYVVPAGSLFIAPAGAIQRIIHHNDPVSGKMGARWIFMGLYANGFRIDDLFSFPVHLTGRTAQRMGELIETLLDASKENGAILTALVCELLLVGKAKTRERPEKEKIKKYILNPFSSHISPDDLAFQINCSKATFYRVFADEFGCTPSAYINDIRLSHAALLLETTNEKISTIADQCGYENPYYFIKLFKRKFGYPPHAYRCVLKAETK